MNNRWIVGCAALLEAACGAGPEENVDITEQAIIPTQVRPASYSASNGWKLDTNGTGVFDSGDQVISDPTFFGPDVLPIAGTWGSHPCSAEKTKIGVYSKRLNSFSLDTNGDGVWTVGVDRSIFVNHSQINPGRQPVEPVSWRLTTSSGCKTVVGLMVYPNCSTCYAKWWINENDNGSLNASDVFFEFGAFGDLPITVRSPVSDATIAGVWRINEGNFYLDYNGDRRWSHCEIDRCVYGFGGPVSWDPLGNNAQPYIGSKSPDDFIHIDFNESLNWDGDPPDLRFAPYGDANTILLGTW